MTVNSVLTLVGVGRLPWTIKNSDDQNGRVLKSVAGSEAPPG